MLFWFWFLLIYQITEQARASSRSATGSVQVRAVDLYAVRHCAVPRWVKHGVTRVSCAYLSACPAAEGSSQTPAQEPAKVSTEFITLLKYVKYSTVSMSIALWKLFMHLYFQHGILVIFHLADTFYQKWFENKKFYNTSNWSYREIWEGQVENTYTFLEFCFVVLVAQKSHTLA